MNTDLLMNMKDADTPDLLDVYNIMKDPQFRQSQYLKVLENIQGNILKDHGRDHSLQFFLRGFGTHETSKVLKDIKLDIENLAQATYRLRRDLHPEKYPKEYPDDFHYVASAKEQYQLGRLSDISEDDYGKTYAVNFFLSHKGYQALGKCPPEDVGFCGGLKAAPKRFLEESGAQVGPTEAISLDDWEAKFDGIDAMILIAHQDKNSLVTEDDEPMIKDPQLKKLIDEFERYIVAIEYGHVLYDGDDPDPKNRKIIEHFGFQDGISNPLFYKSDLDKRRALDIQQHANQYGGYDPSAPLALVLVSDPNCRPEDVAYGSFFVFMKLEQNVRAFNEAILELSKCLEGKNENETIDRAKALVIGRFPDGTPIALQETRGGITKSNEEKTIARYPNNFGYPPAYPPQYGPCPMQTHIRRANPRNTQFDQPGEGNAARVRGRRIVRRGITYGNRNPEPKDNPTLEQLPTKDVGILFMCFQASIRRQFEWIITMWILYNPQRDAMMAAKPPVKKGESQPVCNLWPKDWEQKGPKAQDSLAVHTFGRHVTLKGGEYFFAPSIVFLRDTSQERP